MPFCESPLALSMNFVVIPQADGKAIEVGHDIRIGCHRGIIAHSVVTAIEQASRKPLDLTALYRRPSMTRIWADCENRFMANRSGLSSQNFLSQYLRKN